VKRNVATIKHIIDYSQVFRALGIHIEGILVFANSHALLHLNNPTVAIVKLSQLPSQILTFRSSSHLSREQLEAVGKEILKQKR